MDARACAREQREPQLTLRRPRGALRVRPAAGASLARLGLRPPGHPRSRREGRGLPGIPRHRGEGREARESGGGGDAAGPRAGGLSGRRGPRRADAGGSGSRPAPCPGPRASPPRLQVRARGAAHPGRRISAPLTPGLSISRLGFQCARGWAAAARRPLHAPERGLGQGSRRRSDGPAAEAARAGPAGPGGREKPVPGRRRLAAMGARPEPPAGSLAPPPPAAPPGPTAARPGARPLWPQRALAAFELLTFCQLPSDERNENKYFFPWAVAIPVPSTKGGGRGSRRRSGVGRARPGVYHGPQKRALKTWRLGRAGVA